MEDYANFDAKQAYAQSKAIVKGIVRGTRELGQMLVHPLDAVVYPITGVLYDATIITFKKFNL
jgi:hypothetical protein